jgi:hypothetical protein
LALIVLLAAATLRSRFGLEGDPRVFMVIIGGAIAVVVAVHLPDRRAPRFMGVVAGALALATAVALRLPESFRLTYHVPRIERADAIPAALRPLGAMLADHVPVSSLVLAPPLPSLDFVQVLSKRSLVFSWKNVPYTDRGILEWGARLDSLTGRRHVSLVSEAELAAEWAGRSTSEVEAAARSYGADYILTREEWHTGLRGQRLAEVGGWTLWAPEVSRGGTRK